MKLSGFKTLYLPLSLILIVGCGGGKEEEEFKFYALKEATSQQLELTVEASGTVEAISSIEIKSSVFSNLFFLNLRTLYLEFIKSFYRIILFK